MALFVLKFGGTSVKDIERIKNAASKVAAEAKLGHKIAVVVSAMAGVTDKMIEYCNGISPVHDMREHDAVVSTGEQVTAGLMAMALQQRGLNARSWMGWQIPLCTDSNHNKARITDINAASLRDRIEQGEIAVIAGFQGISEDQSITTLGRGGSDTSAVALAAALKADRCDIYTDVDGVYTTDPRITSKAHKLKRISYDEMLELASLGAKVLQTRSVEMAMRHGVSVQVLSTFTNAIGSEYPGTLVTNEETTMEQRTVTGIAYSLNGAKITLIDVADTPGVAAIIFGALARAGINVDMIVQTSSESGTTSITFTVEKNDLDRSLHILESERPKIKYTNLLADKDIAKISLVGLGMKSNPGIAAKMFETMAEKKINIQAIETSEISISVLISEEYTELAVRALHSAYGLDKS
ncbi:MAG: aspartate kinase [Alphaproteobacteria bacterium]|nr:aspartate kinase [Alphaproteobacteria bacterium]